MMDHDIELAKELERQILGDRCPLGCGCLIKKICTHPNGELVLMEYAIFFCELHEKNPWALWLGKGYYMSNGSRATWIHKKDGEIVSDGWWSKEIEKLPGSMDGHVVSLEGKHIIGRRTGMAFVGSITTNPTASE